MHEFFSSPLRLFPALRRLLRIVAIAFLFTSAAPDLRSESPTLAPGTTFTLGGKTATITKVDALPLVENEYSVRFKFDSASNPKLKDLRDRYQLDRLVAAGTNEFDRQVLLMDWVHNRFRKFGQPPAPPKARSKSLKASTRGTLFSAPSMPS